LRCLIVDDNTSFLTVATELLEREGLEVVGAAATAAEALARTRELLPDVVLLDIVLGDESGLDVARQLAVDAPRPPVVIFISTHSQSDFAELVGSAPAAGFVPKAELSAAAVRRLVG